MTWIHSYVVPDKTRTFCIERNGLPVDRISEVRVLDPYVYL